MFNEAERAVFGPYFNGEREVYADPLKVYRRLVSACEGDPNAVLRDARSDDQATRHRAKERLYPAASYALDMVPFNPVSGTGALEQDVKAALRLYLEWVKKKEQTGPTLPTCSTGSETPSLAGGSSTTPTTPPYGSTFPAFGVPGAGP